MLFRINHIDKRSSLGGEDTSAVYLWLETPEGNAYVPAGNIGDNPVAVNLHKRNWLWRQSSEAKLPTSQER
jgi:hypothetical protein